jgi:CRISPR/Cas system endoribonuclease Cas6 (RAMP superfamily)
MKVTKRNGSTEPISFDKILGRIRKASKGLHVNPDSLTQQVLARIYDCVKTSEIDELTSQLAASLSTTHPDYGTLAARIAISNHQKNTDSSFTNVMVALNNQVNPKTQEHVSYVNDEIISINNKIVCKITKILNSNRNLRVANLKIVVWSSLRG